VGCEGEVYVVMKGIYEEKYSGDDPIVKEFQELLGDQAPTEKAIEKNPTNVLKVYRQILQYYKAYEEKKTPGTKEEEKTFAEERTVTLQAVLQ
jgi:hypothetical protein